jgi:hypothetical protein
MAALPDEPPAEDDDDVGRRSALYGHTAAIDSVGTTAAPPLAGFAFALIVLVLQQPASFAAPGPTLALLTGAAVSLITCVQLVFIHRRHHVPPDVWAGWAELAADDERNAHRAAYSARYFADLERGKPYRVAAAWTYNGGITLLLGGVLVSLWPDDGGNVGRWLAVGIAAGALAGEVVWSVALLARRARRRGSGLAERVE